MNRGLTLFVILSFTGLAVFGFLGMGFHDAEHSMNGCIAALQRETSCLAMSGSFEFAVFHLNAFKIFSSAGSEVSVFFNAMLAVFALFLFYFFGPSKYKLPSVLSLAKDSDEYRRSLGFFIPKEQKLISWLALHRVRDTVFCF